MTEAENHCPLNEDFRKFVELVAEAVVVAREESCGPSAQQKIWPPDFERCETDFERVCILMQLPTVRQFSLLSAAESPSCQDGMKSDEVVRKCRMKALDCRGEILSSLDAWTEAVFGAKSTGCRYKAFYSRSRLLEHLRAHEAELDDINRCLENVPPVDEQWELHFRRGHLLRKLGEYEAAYAEFLEARVAARFDSEVLPDIVLYDSIHRCKCRDSVDRNMHPLLRFISRQSTGVRIIKTIPLPDSNSGGHAFHVKRDGSLGLHLVASRDIAPGELIAAEKPYVRVLNPGKELRHCYRCCKRSLNLTPCRGCSEVGFCSTRCERETWMSDWWYMNGNESPGEIVDGPELDQFHRFECGQRSRILLTDVGGLQWLKVFGSTTCTSPRLRRYSEWLGDLDPIEYPTLDARDVLLAFACVARTHWHDIWRLARGQANEDIKEATNSRCPVKRPSSIFAFSGQENVTNTTFRLGTYDSVSWRNAEPHNTRSTEDLWQRTVAAVFLAHCLSAGGYPLDWKEDPMMNPLVAHAEDDRPKLPASWAAACLLYHLQVGMRATRGQTVVRYEEQDSDGNSVRTTWDYVRITSESSGIYALLSLTSHACDQNSSVITVDGVGEGLFALRSIKAGTEISFSLCDRHKPTAARQELLIKRFGIHCQCTACHKNWPVEHEVLVMPQCQLCGHQVPVHGCRPDAHGGRSGCRCPMRIRCNQPLAIVQQQDQRIVNRPRVIRYSEILPLDEISVSEFDRCIADTVQNIKALEEHENLSEPCGNLNSLEDQLQQLLNFRHGQYYMLSVISTALRIQDHIWPPI
ncbi:unnamed protein product [Dicrocoelium dendriticum]|nr:unnamed protein product [Dicrocoelium dendriticum]